MFYFDLKLVYEPRKILRWPKLVARNYPIFLFGLGAFPRLQFFLLLQLRSILLLFSLEPVCSSYFQRRPPFFFSSALIRLQGDRNSYIPSPHLFSSTTSFWVQGYRWIETSFDRSTLFHNGMIPYISMCYDGVNHFGLNMMSLLP